MSNAFLLGIQKAINPAAISGSWLPKSRHSFAK
jgi:hypothetical protein